MKASASLMTFPNISCCCLARHHETKKSSSSLDSPIKSYHRAVFSVAAEKIILWQSGKIKMF